MIIGDGPLKNEIQRIFPRAIMPGWLSTTELREKLRLARAFVLPSVWYEVGPIITLEAMAMGIPVIVSSATSYSEIISDGINGFLFEAGNVNELADKMKLLEDPQIAKRVGRASYESYWNNSHTLKDHIDQLLEIYDKILIT